MKRNNLSQYEVDEIFRAIGAKDSGTLQEFKVACTSDTYEEYCIRCDLEGVERAMTKSAFEAYRQLRR